MSYYICLPIMTIIVALQSSIVPQFRIYSGQPDLVLLVVLCWAVYATLNEALFWAFTGGILQDLMSVAPLGTSLIGLIIVVFAIYSLREMLFDVNILVVIGFMIVGTFLQKFIAAIMLALIGLGSEPSELLQYVIAPTLFYNALLLFPIYGFVSWVHHQTTLRRRSR